jgi:hypothetical protein
MAYYKTRKSMYKATNGLYYSNGNNTTETEVESDDEAAEAYETVISFNIPALIRILEITREEIKTDNALHILVEGIMKAAADGDAIDMDDIEEIYISAPQRRPLRRLRDGRLI